MLQRIREAKPADAKRLAPLVEQYWKFEGISGFDQGRVEALLRTALAQPQQLRAWVAEADGNPVGYLLCSLVFSLELGGTVGEIDELFVEPESRSAGFGQQMLDAARTSFLASGVTHWQLQLGSGNSRARRFYERNGFVDRPEYRLLQQSVV